MIGLRLCRTIFVLLAACTSTDAAEHSTFPASNWGEVDGIVLGKPSGKPIALARVFVSSPATEMRGARASDGQGVFEGLTDSQGRFRISVPHNQKIAINVFAPGYRELAGRWMGPSGGFQEVAFTAGKVAGLKIELEPALYVSGIAVDEDGVPLSDVQVEATLWDQTGFGYVAFNQTDGQGRFEIFDFSVSPLGPSGKARGRGQITFEHPRFLKSTIPDIYALTRSELGRVQVILRKGRELRGTLTTTGGTTVSNTLVDALPSDEQATKRQATTDSAGRFVLNGLPPGAVTLIAHSLSLKQKARKVLNLSQDRVEISLQLQPIVYRHPPKAVEVLGMALADLTPEVQEVYELYTPHGVVILNPGVAHLHLGIGPLTEGDSFWIVGEREIGSVRELVTELLRVNSIDPPGQPNEGCRGSVRVVYQLPRRAGTNTQRLALSDHEVEDLKKLAASLGSPTDK